jgi:NAD(P)H-dependent flavin oxidoreductase YrpB (nitropropane dioxygenase family)
MAQGIGTRFTKKFGLRFPIAQAGMAFAGWSPPLAAAISAAGGMGAIGAGLLPPDAVRGIVQGLKQARCGPFNINFLTPFDHQAQVEICAEEKVPVVSFHWGHPTSSVIRLLKDAGCSVWLQVGTVEDAKRAVGEGIDVVVAQGHEAGGHNYQGMGSFALIPAVRDAIGDTLLLAAGGVSDGRGLAAALMLGADGVWVGTRFVATTEAFVHDEHKRRLVQAQGSDTTLSSIFGPEQPSFNPMRVLKNGVVNEWNHRLAEVPTQRDHLPQIGTTVLGGEHMVLRKFSVLLPTPDMAADWDEVPFLSGQGVGLIHDILPAADVVAQMAAQASGLLAGAGAFAKT